MPILAILGSRAALYAAIVGLGAMLVMCWFTGSNLRRDLAHTTADLKSTRVELVGTVRDLTTCQNNTRSLNASLEAQNAAVASLEQAGREASKRAQAALAKARKASDAASVEAARILNLQPQGDVCASALQLMRQP
jgi:ABC-type transport system involved in cytochrome bd biosynthesis fused ATPase/permease subunit